MRAYSFLALLLTAGCGCSGASTTLTHPDGQAVETPDATSEPDAVSGPTVILGSPATPVSVTLARTATERARGLMGVMSLPADAGMLFIFPQDDDHEFWMKNTLIPLDMIFIRADMTVAGVVANAVPMSLDPRGVGQQSRFVLEVNGGWAAAHGVTNDSPVSFEGFTP